MSTRESRKVAREMVQAAALLFLADLNEATLSDHDLDRFLSETQSAGTDRGSRLIHLAGARRGSLNWQTVCFIYEEVLRHEPPNAGTHLSWILLGLEWYMIDSSIPLEERCHAANDTRKLLDEALRLSPNDGSFAFMYGLLYYKHPARDDFRNEFLRTALDWFFLTMKWRLEEDGEEDDWAKLYIGHCWFELGELSKALESYQSISNDFISGSESEMSEDEQAQLSERINLCKPS